MLLGARQFFVVSKGTSVPTARDYVQSGLVAMWDGIENAGWGTHDASATAWKDLISGNNTAQLPTGWGWMEDHLIVTSGAPLVFPCAFSESRTIEYVFKVVSFGDECLFESGGANSSLRFKLLTSNGVSVFWNNGRANTTIASWEEVTSQPLSISVAIQNQQTDGFTWNYKNGNLFNSKTLESPSSTANTPNWQIGRPNINAGSPQWTFSIRSYNRVLSAAEIAANYAVDKVRFNLP